MAGGYGSSYDAAYGAGGDGAPAPAPDARDLTVDTDFASVIARSHRAVSVAEILAADGSVAQTLTSITGSVTIAAAAARRRTMNLAIVDAVGDLTPTGMDSLLAPVTVEVRLRRGVEYADGTQELWPLGVFRVDADDIDFAGGQITMTGVDRSAVISRNRWLEPWVIDVDTPSTAAIAAIARDRYPSVVIDMAASDHAVTVDTVFGDNTTNDPWTDILELGRAAGLDVFFDPAGVFTTRPFPDTSGGPTRTYSDGPGGDILGGARRLEGGDIRNGVIVYGEGADGSQVVGSRWDTNPASPTYAGNPVGSSVFGARPYVYESKVITTYQQAVEVADLLLGKVLRLGDGVQFTALVDPRVDVDEVCGVAVARPQLDGVYVTQQLTVPLDIGAGMQVQAGTRRTLATVG